MNILSIFTKEIETDFTSPWKKIYTPVILKDDLEYKEEGNYQNHCVGSYVRYI